MPPTKPGLLSNFTKALNLEQTATIQGANGKSASVNFGVGNADQLFASSNDSAFSTLAGPNPGTFDWGLPFFFGRNVYTAILGKNTPGGAWTFWAY